MNLIQVIVLSILQGVSELFPVSSLGHAVLLPKLLHWNINERSDTWLAFLVALHLGTATALLVYFRDEWIEVVRAFVRSVQKGQMGNDHDERLAWMVIAGTIPAGVVGLALQTPLKNLFASPYAAACFLILNGGIMFAGEWLIQRQQSAETVEETQQMVAAGHSQERLVDSPSGSHPRPLGKFRDITQLSWRDAAVVGFAQVGALFPGISRSGVTMVAGLGAGLTHEAAARFAFLLATPIIFAAGILEIPKLFEPAGRSVLGDAILGAILAGLAAYAAVRFLMRYFEGGRLYPFAYYSIGVGVGSILLLAAGA